MENLEKFKQTNKKIQLPPLLKNAQGDSLCDLQDLKNIIAMFLLPYITIFKQSTQFSL